MGELVEEVETAAPITPTGKCCDPDEACSICSEVLGRIFLGGVDILSPVLLSLRPLGPIVAILLAFGKI